MLIRVVVNTHRYQTKYIQKICKKIRDTELIVSNIFKLPPEVAFAVGGTYERIVRASKRAITNHFVTSLHNQISNYLGNYLI